MIDTEDLCRLLTSSMRRQDREQQEQAALQTEVTVHPLESAKTRGCDCGKRVASAFFGAVGEVGILVSCLTLRS